MRAAGEAPWSLTAEGARVHVRLTPKSSTDAIEAIETLSDGRRVFRARVRAAPENGAANLALCRAMAKALGLSRGAARIVSGATSRLKVVALDGDPADLAARLAKLADSVAG